MSIYHTHESTRIAFSLPVEEAFSGKYVVRETGKQVPVENEELTRMKKDILGIDSAYQKM
jgi:hypothetical protein